MSQTINDLRANCRQAITTTYRGPTNHRGSRVIATCEAKRITVSWDHALNADANHAAAALQLMRELGWDGELLPGTPSIALCVASDAETRRTGTGAVCAYLLHNDAVMWVYVPDREESFHRDMRGREVITVYVAE